MGGLSDLLKVSRHLAGTSGKIFYVFPASRLSEMMEEASLIGLNVRRLRLLRSAPFKTASLFLVELGCEGGLNLKRLF